MPKDLTCIKCNGEMELGFLRDHVGGASVPGQWIAGAPEQGWSGTAKIRNKTRYEVEVFRCSECGYLEQYARIEMPAAGILQND
jgi:predicted nucleic-acid-binding Zn-ribbon protein